MQSRWWILSLTAIAIILNPIFSKLVKAELVPEDTCDTLDPVIPCLDKSLKSISSLASHAIVTQPPTIEEIKTVAELQPRSPSQPQVTSVSQLSDVQPTDWAFQALQSLVERYGCIAGYPDGTYRGDRALTRYEFAAGLNACLERITELINTSTQNLVSRDDLIKLQRLQEEFAAELASLSGIIYALEARSAELEANQFSTTTGE